MTLTRLNSALTLGSQSYSSITSPDVLGLIFAKRMKLYSKPDGFMLYGKLGIDFLTTSEVPYPNMKVRIRIIRARPSFYMISANPNVGLGIVDCSLYNRRVMLKEDSHKK